MTHRAPLLARYGHHVAPAAANVFELLIAVMSLIAAVSFFLIPDALADSSIGRTLAPWGLLWNGMYFFGALFIITGIIKERIGVEAAGLWLLSSAILIAAIATAVYRGWSAAPALATYASAALACMVRLYFLRLLSDALENVDSFLREVQSNGE